ncbi:MAG: 50S ribosomal protein L10 [Victivallaceae bacterium]|jgi:large subunit ribosomal protein L10|nr:50S ribosomal protein L10 [Victivallaceae bacterium]NLK83894.1 50S ribosomal protein L10 [Lentisphaerota bacterium]MDD3116101.1 50S ribosomal protein L10 [Victivallaceae bacterium]MDD3703090.1 50S ribosomal protein L10 [Victivallaceae bacterium]MDD4316998.1 50S ribosomal protein L10 [Victivallaceae bacterium]
MRNEKVHLINYIGGLLNDSEFVYFVNCNNMTVKEISALRNKLVETGVFCRSIKNNLLRKTVEVKEISCLNSFEFRGSTMVISGSGDPSPAAKIIDEFAKTNDKLSAVGGILEGASLSAEDVKSIASLPAREVLYSMLLSVMLGPARGLVTVLNAKASSIVNVINAYKNKLESN